MHNKSIKEIQQDLISKKYSVKELVNHFISRIEKYDSKLNSLITFTKQEALQQAEQMATTDISTMLQGIPLIHKDVLCTKGVKTSCGSKMLDNFIAPYNATIVDKMKNAGMIMLGKANMDEFAMGSSTENSFYGVTRNPWNLECVPGGSSGGSAALIAARLIPATTGTDTGGSIRQPASFCGISGLKPTYGRVSRFGLIAYASSLDQAGPMAKSVEDVAYLLNAMAGYDPKDSTSMNNSPTDYSVNLSKKITGKKLGIPIKLFEDLDGKINDKIQKFIDELKKLGAKITEIELPNIHLSVPTYYIIAPSECSSNLARFDGIRFGYQYPNPKNLLEQYTKSRGIGFGDEVKRRIMLGTYTLSAGYYDAYYLKAQKIRRIILDDYLKAFAKVDAIVMPTTPTTAFKIGEKINDPISMYLSDIYTVGINLAGLPSLSLPIGFIDNMPIGAQIIGKHFSEDMILNIGHQYQLVTDWHKQNPLEFN